MESSRNARHTVRNEGEAHPMSLETTKTVEPNLFAYDEGYQGRTLAIPAKSGRGQNDHWSGHHHGGVGGHGMCVMVEEIRNEISGDELQGSTAGTSGQTARPVWSSEKSERSIVAMKAVMKPERRGRTWWTRTAKQRTRRWFLQWK